MSKCLLPIDEINKLKTAYSANEIVRAKKSAEDVIDEVLDILILSYFSGREQALNDLGIKENNLPFDNEDEYQGAEETAFRKVAGKDFAERIDEYIHEDGTTTDWIGIERVMETEAHRAYTEGAYSVADKNGATKKTWKTMMDNRVRETHDYREGLTIGIDEYFYSPSGDKGMYPGGFETPEENVNCRCWLEFSK